MIMFGGNERRPGSRLKAGTGGAKRRSGGYWPIRKVNAQRIENWAPDQVRRDEHPFWMVPSKLISLYRLTDGFRLFSPVR